MAHGKWNEISFRRVANARISPICIMSPGEFKVRHASRALGEDPISRQEFEFDPGKSEINKSKHGIDFVEAQALWKSPWLERPAKAASEKRYLKLARLAARIGQRL